MNFSIDCNTIVDNEGFILANIRNRIEERAGRSGNAIDFASQFASRCGMTFGDLAKFMKGDLSVPPERARRIETALDAIADREGDSDVGGFNGGGGGGGDLAIVSAGLDEMLAEIEREEAAAAAAPVMDRRDEVEHQVEDEAAAIEPETVEPEPVELEPIEPVELILEDAIERDRQRRHRALAILTGSAPIELSEPVESVAIDEAERDAMVAEPESVEFEPRPPRSRTKAKPNKSTGSHDVSRDKRAASAVAGIVTKPKPRSMSSTRGQLATLRREARRRLTALQNATKTRSDRMLRQLAGREAEVVAWWLAYAYARVLYGPDATQQQIAETKVDLDAAADPGGPKAKPNRRQAQTAIERTHRLEARGMPWQRYVTHGAREFREIFGRSAASELAPPLHRPDHVSD